MSQETWKPLVPAGDEWQVASFRRFLSCLNVSVGLSYVILPWTKKKNHPRDSRREERCPTCDHARSRAISAGQKSRTVAEGTLPSADRSWSRMISHVAQRSSRLDSRSRHRAQSTCADFPASGFMSWHDSSAEWPRAESTSQLASAICIPTWHWSAERDDFTEIIPCAFWKHQCSSKTVTITHCVIDVWIGTKNSMAMASERSFVDLCSIITGVSPPWHQPILWGNLHLSLVGKASAVQQGSQWLAVTSFVRTVQPELDRVVGILRLFIQASSASKLLLAFRIQHIVER